MVVWMNEWMNTHWKLDMEGFIYNYGYSSLYVIACYENKILDTINFFNFYNVCFLFLRF